MPFYNINCVLCKSIKANNADITQNVAPVDVNKSRSLINLNKIIFKIGWHIYKCYKHTSISSLKSWAKSFFHTYLASRRKHIAHHLFTLAPFLYQFIIHWLSWCLYLCALHIIHWLMANDNVNSIIQSRFCWYDPKNMKKKFKS